MDMFGAHNQELEFQKYGPCFPSHGGNARLVP